MSGMSCIASSGFEVGVGLAPCWCCADCASCAKAEAEKRMKERANTDRNERFMSILTAVLECCVINRRANAANGQRQTQTQIRRASTWWGGEKEARKSAEGDAKKRKAKVRSN